MFKSVSAMLGKTALAAWVLFGAVICAAAQESAATSANASAAAAPAELRFRDFFRYPIGPAGLEITDVLRAADGQRVRLTGYMVAQEGLLRGHLFLTPVPVTMSEPADGDADDLPAATVLVQMPEVDRDLPLLPARGLLQLTGTLRVGRHEMADGRIVWVRLLLEPRPEPAP